MKKALKERIVDLRSSVSTLRQRDESQYWEDRYRRGGNSGDGSYGRLRQYKADVLNKLVTQNDIGRVVEVGCGDGAQLELANYREYIGLDVSRSAISIASQRHDGDSSKSFFAFDPAGFIDNLGLFQADMSISLDVIYHLLTESSFLGHLDLLFSLSRNLVVLYTSDSGSLPTGLSDRAHIHHWPVREVIADRFGASWQLASSEVNPYRFDPSDEEPTSFAEFLVYREREG